MNDNNPFGFNIKFCYSCDISPPGQDIITFSYDNLEVTALERVPIDCNFKN